VPHVNQMDLITAITKELGRQGLIEVNPRQYNALIAAVDDICAALYVEHIPALPNIGLLRWLASDETGSSSKYLAYTLFPSEAPKAEYAHPHDIGDFKRCVGLINSVPEAKNNLDLIRERSPQWDAVCENWDAWVARIENEDKTVRDEIYDIIRLHDVLR
jgi:hypothetical protein